MAAGVAQLREQIEVGVAEECRQRHAAQLFEQALQRVPGCMLQLVRQLGIRPSRAAQQVGAQLAFPDRLQGQAHGRCGDQLLVDHFGMGEDRAAFVVVGTHEPHPFQAGRNGSGPVPQCRRRPPESVAMHS
jgi:hypothetical protein